MKTPDIDDFNELAEKANETGEIVTVFKDGKPWVDIVPRATEDAQSDYLVAGLETMIEYREMFEELAKS